MKSDGKILRADGCRNIPNQVSLPVWLAHNVR
jgi:hypothetical protein